jgi:hypothetical protein
MGAISVTDTSIAAAEKQLQAQTRMTGEQRLLLAFEMSLFTRELAAAGIRDQHPEWPEFEVARELLRRSFPPGKIPPVLR